MADEKCVSIELCDERYGNLEKRVDRVECMLEKAIERLNKKVDTIIFLMISMLSSALISILLLILKK